MSWHRNKSVQVRFSRSTNVQEKKGVPVIGNLLELLPAHLVVNQENSCHDAQHLVQQVHLGDCVLLIT